MLRLVGTLVGALAILWPAVISGQSLTSGALRGVVRTVDRAPVAGASVNVESEAGSVLAAVETDQNGSFSFGSVAAGRYRLLVERAGFQPIRYHRLSVSGGRTTVLVAFVERRPPPVDSVVNREAVFVQTGGDGSRFLTGAGLEQFDARSDLSDVSRALTEVAAPVDGSSGLAVMAAGAPATRTRLVVDGIEEGLIRHPGLRGLAAQSPAFPRGAIEQSGFLLAPHDVEWSLGSGGILTAQTRAGTNETVFAPYLAASSGRLGGRTADNPADSSATSFRVGLMASGAIRRDTIHYAFRADYQSVELGSPNLWLRDSSRYRDSPVGLASTLAAIAVDSFGRSVDGLLAAPRRTWKGGSVLGRVDWRLSAANRFMIRSSFADVKEQAPTFGTEVAATSVSVASRDVSVAAILVTSSGRIANEARVGFSTARRDWQGPSLPSASLVGDQVSFGGRPFAPGRFDLGQFELTDAAQYSAGSHRLKFGGSLKLLRYEQQYRVRTTPTARYGSLDDFAVGRGAAEQFLGDVEPISFRVSEPGVFVQESWTATPEFELQLGLRLGAQILPANRIGANAAWLASSGISNSFLPKAKALLEPRGAFAWNVRGEGRVVVRGAASLHYDRLDPAIFAEAIQTGDNLRVTRAIGEIGDWPYPSGLTSGTTATTLTFFAPSYRQPRSLKLDGGVTFSMGDRSAFSVTGYFGHTDFLLRRTDLNRVATAVGQTTEGRPLYGSLAKFTGLVTGEPGSGRRFGAFDQVFGLAPTGYSDHTEVTALFEGRPLSQLSLAASYTYARTRDNTIGLLSADPADQLSPFPEGLGGADWTEGISDFDLPHRLAGMVEFRNRGAVPVVVGVRGRWRSGFPFTAGLPAGTDLNSDGSGNNDPAYLAGGLVGLGERLAAGGCGALTTGFAVRNSCREKSVGSLDLRVGFGLPIGGRRPLMLTIDAFNVVSTVTGIVDRALVAPDPSRPLAVGADGRVTIPFVINARFGGLLARRGEPRWIRASLRLEY